MSDKKYKVGYFVGSNSKASINRRVAQGIINQAPEQLEFTEIEWDDFPVYNRDMDEDFPKNFPESYLRAKELVKEQDAILFITPEYNRGVPGGLKNALDAMSRPYGTSPFAGKPAATAGVSISTIGTAVAQSGLRPTLTFLGMPQMGQPEVYFKYEDGAVDPEGVFNDEDSKKLIQNFVKEFANFIEEINHSA